MNNLGTHTFTLKSKIPVGENYIPQEYHHLITKAWKELTESVNSIALIDDKSQINIFVDWGDTADRIRLVIEDSISYEQDFRQIKGDVNLFEFAKEHVQKTMKLHHEILVSFRVEAKKRSQESISQDFYLGCISHFLHRVFLAMNIAVPGSCDFYLSEIHSDFTEPNKPAPATLTLLLSAASIEQGIISSQILNWPTIQFLSVNDVWNWLESVCPITTVVAKTNLQRGLVSLLYASTSQVIDYIDPAKLVWLAHALEALFDAPTQGIAKSLRDRIFLALGEPSGDNKKIRKSISSFYDFRSSFVHGDFEIFFPTSYSLYNKETNKVETDVLQSVGIATSIILAILQKLTIQKWNGLIFSELFSGKPLDS